MNQGAVWQDPDEESAIPVFHEDAVRICTSLNKRFEIVFVNDGSTDNTLKVIKNLAKQDNRIHLISFSRNFGKEAAIFAGLQATRGDYIVTMDVDGQDPPSLIPDMLEAVVSGEYDCAGTRRVNRIGEPPVRSSFARRFYAVMKKNHRNRDSGWRTGFRVDEQEISRGYFGIT